jgi:hypothetical protein
VKAYAGIAEPEEDMEKTGRYVVCATKSDFKIRKFCQLQASAHFHASAVLIMSENLQLVARGSSTSGPTLREVAAVFFRQTDTEGSFAARDRRNLHACSPLAKSRKVLVRRGRIDPAVTSTQTRPRV